MKILDGQRLVFIGDSVTDMGRTRNGDAPSEGLFEPLGKGYPHVVSGLLNAFYPDYVLDNGTPRTLSSQINNPAYLYTVYYQGSVLGMNALLQDEDLTIDEYVVNFSDPQNYTLIQIKKDPFTPLALAGGLITMLGLILAFYLLPVQVCAVQGDDGKWMVAGSCRKGGSIFREKLLKAAQESENTAGARAT